MSLEDLEKRLAALESEVASLRANRTGSMRDTQCCPACGGRSILVFTQVTERGHMDRISIGALAHATSWRGVKDLAPLQAFVCRACGKVEWYATGLEDVAVDGTIVRLLEGAPDSSDAGPYR